MSMTSEAQAEALCKEANRCVRKGQPAEAVELYKKALELSARLIPAHEGIATAYFLQKDYENAAEHFKRVTLLDPRQTNALVNLGAVYNCTKDFNKAVGILRKAISRDKSSGEAFYNLGLAYRGLEQQAMAISAYREAVRVSPLMASAHQNLANVYVDIGNYQQAIAHYMKALEIDPNFERAKRGLERARQSSDVARKAVSPFGRLVDVEAHGAKAAPRMERELTDLERFQDRTAVYELAMAVQDAANSFLKQFREDFEVCLAGLNRAVAQGPEGPRSIPRCYREYVAALKKSVDLRQALKRAILELRAHEERMNTPDLDAPSPA